MSVTTEGLDQHRDRSEAVLRAIRHARPDHEGEVIVKLSSSSREVVTLRNELRSRGNTVVCASEAPSDFLYVRGPDAGAEFHGAPWSWFTPRSTREAQADTDAASLRRLAEAVRSVGRERGYV